MLKLQKTARDRSFQQEKITLMYVSEAAYETVLKNICSFFQEQPFYNIPGGSICRTDMNFPGGSIMFFIDRSRWMLSMCVAFLAYPAIDNF